MKRLMALLLSMLLALTASVQAAAHALEPIAGLATAEAAYSGHWAGDGDEVPADADKAVPHHHAACHDHGIAMPTPGGLFLPHEPGVPVRPRAGTTALAGSDPESPLRPPTA